MHTVLTILQGIYSHWERIEPFEGFLLELPGKMEEFLVYNTMVPPAQINLYDL